MAIGAQKYGTGRLFLACMIQPSSLFVHRNSVA